MRTSKFIVMLGTDLRAPGGMTAVVQAYRDDGLFNRWPVRFLASYHRSGVLNKLSTAAGALLCFMWWLACAKVAAVHAHVAARGSFWRKSVFLALAMLCKRRTVFHLHDGSFPAWYESRSPLAKGLVRRMLRSVDCVVVLTEGWRSRVAAIEPRARLTVLRNPVHIPAQPSNRRPGRVLFMGRLWRDKGIFDLLEAALKVKPKVDALHLVCAGDGELDEVRRWADAHGMAACVSLPGWVDGQHKAALLADAALFVLPSYFEGLPVGVLEAMAWGVPVVASDVGGVAEALGHDSGVLIQAGDVDGLARAMERVLCDEVTAAAMAHAGRERATTHFARGLVVAQLEQVYRGLGLSPKESSLEQPCAG